MTNRHVLVLVIGALLAAFSMAQQPQAFSLPESVTRRAIDFWSEGTRLSADIYAPKNRDTATKLPTVVLCNGWGGTRRGAERMAARLAENGFIAFTFDY